MVVLSLLIPFFQDDWDSDFDDESASQVCCIGVFHVLQIIVHPIDGENTSRLEEGEAPHNFQRLLTVATS